MKFNNPAIARIIRHIPPAALALTSCTLGPDFIAPDPAVGSKWKETRAVSGTRLPDDWWRLVDDLATSQARTELEIAHMHRTPSQG